MRGARIGCRHRIKKELDLTVKIEFCSVFADFPIAYRAVLGTLDMVLLHRSEQHRDAPDTRQGDERIYDTAEHGQGAATDPGNKIEGKQTDATPV